MCEEICFNCLYKTFSVQADKNICDNEESPKYGLVVNYQGGCNVFSEREGADDR